jgi:hypothetical protein
MGSLFQLHSLLYEALHVFDILIVCNGGQRGGVSKVGESARVQVPCARLGESSLVSMWSKLGETSGSFDLLSIHVGRWLAICVSTELDRGGRGESAPFLAYSERAGASTVEGQDHGKGRNNNLINFSRHVSMSRVREGEDVKARFWKIPGLLLWGVMASAFRCRD